MSDIALFLLLSYLQHNNRSLKILTFMSELKAGKQRALDLLSHIPHVIPHRKVHMYMGAYYFWLSVQIMILSS
jgi:TRAP-type mannitol/chloroaromatic compound transport system permease small subunit